MPKIVDRHIQTPGPCTLRKYGLTERDWLLILDQQGSKCGACGRVPRTGRLVIDHEHVRRWAKLKTEDRKRYVRGAICWT